MKYICVTGDRRYTPTLRNRILVYNILIMVAFAFHIRDGNGNRDFVLLHGGARGLDTLCAEQAKRFGWIVEEFLPDYLTHGKAAPHVRNDMMLNTDPDVVIGFPLHNRELAPGEDRRFTSRGTWSVIEKAIKRDLPTIHIKLTESEDETYMGVGGNDKGLDLMEILNKDNNLDYLTGYIMPFPK